MNVKAGVAIHPYLDEGYKMLREKYKCGAIEARDVVRDFLNHVIFKWPEDRVVKNPRRELLNGLRGWIAQRRKEDREWAMKNK